MKPLTHHLMRMVLLVILAPWCLVPVAEAQSGRYIFNHSESLGDSPGEAAVARFLQLATTRRAVLARVNSEAFDADQLQLNPFPGMKLEAVQTRIGFSGARHRAWFGNLSDQQGSAVFIIHGNRISGKITSTHGVFEVFPLGGGDCVIVEHDPEAFPGCGMNGPAVPLGPQALNATFPAPPVDTADASFNAPVESVSTVDFAESDTSVDNRVRVLVAYTAGARNNTQTVFGRTMQEHVDLAIAESNQGYANSGVALRIELACLYQTGFTETTAIEVDVIDFRNNGDGKGDEVHQFRTDYDADMCCLLTDGTDRAWCGWAYGYDYASRENMFQVTSYACATSNFTFAHEFGHTQGCRHNDDMAVDPFPYGHGFRNDDNWRTIMALANYTLAPRLNYWSNPSIESPVIPCTALGTAVDGDRFANDCRTALNVGGLTVVNHETTPTFSTAPTNGIFNSDEYADKVVTGDLAVGAFMANPGSRIQFRAGLSILLQPGFQARVGSEFHAHLASPLGESPPGDGSPAAAPVSLDETLNPIE